MFTNKVQKFAISIRIFQVLANVLLPWYLEWCIGDTLGGAIVWFWTSDAKFDANLPMSQWLDSQDKGCTDWIYSN